jgi:hypothetical protein
VAPVRRAEVAPDGRAERRDRLRQPRIGRGGGRIAPRLLLAQVGWVEEAGEFLQEGEAIRAVRPEGRPEVIVDDGPEVDRPVPQRAAQHGHAEAGREEGALHLATDEAVQPERGQPPNVLPEDGGAGDTPRIR